MQRRDILTGLSALLGAQMVAAAACAATAAEQVIEQLKAQGFDHIEQESTWLGRVRIVAERGDASREIILNPNTGEILRDLWLTKGGNGAPIVQIGRDDTGGNSGHGNDDDEDEDEDEDKDKSGHGGGGSGEDPEND